MKVILPATISLAVCLWSLAAEEILNVPPEVKLQMEKVRSGATTFAETHGKESVFFKNAYSVKIADRNSFQQNAYIFQSKDFYNLEVLPDGRLIKFFNNYAFDRGRKGTSKKQLEFDSPTSPQWSEEKAIQVATEYVQAILGNLPDNVGAPTAKYNNSDRNAPKYLMGKWIVRWEREDKKTGYKFNGVEGIAVNIFEAEGPYALYANMYSNFNGLDFEPLKLESVMPEAIKRAEQTLQWNVIRSHYANGKLVPNMAVGRLKIVQPNHFGTGADIPTRPDLNARLAWAIWFPWVSDTDKTPDFQHPSRGLVVWIDAQNGKWLGGDGF